MTLIYGASTATYTNAVSSDSEPAVEFVLGQPIVVAVLR